MRKKLSNGVRKLGGRISKVYNRVNRGRLRFKKQHPQLYRLGKKALLSGAKTAMGPNYALARGAYNAYRGPRTFSYQARNAVRTGYQYASARGFQEL